MGRPDDPRRLTAAGAHRPAAADLDRLLTGVRRALDGLAEGTSAVVAVSGGADSVALLHLVTAARPDLRLVVGHVRHGLRDDARDAAAAVAAATELGMPVVVRQVAVGEGDGPEDAARRARHDALAAMAAEVGATAVLLGHTADDQAETLLLRLARGTGPDGLAGMAPETRRGDLRLLRPLLALRRADVRAVPPPGTWVEDPTNADPGQRRARARHEVLPALGRLRPDEGDPVPALVRLADLARADREALAHLTATAVLGRCGAALLVPRSVGAGALRGVQSRLLRAAWRLLPGNPQPPAAAVIDRLLDLPHGRRSDEAGGVAVTASARGWVLDPTGGAAGPATALPVGGAAVLPTHGLVLHCTLGTAPASLPPAPRPNPPAAHGGVVPAAGVVGTDPVPRILPLDPAPWVLHLPPSAGPLSVGSRASAADPTSGHDAGTRAVREELRRMVPVGMRHLVPVLRDETGRALAVGSRALVRPAPGGPCLVVTAGPTDA